MSNWYQNDSILADYERERLSPDYDVTSAKKSVKKRIKELEAVIEELECSDYLDENQCWQLEDAQQELHDLRAELNY